METISLADATSRLSELVASVEETGERVLITKAGRPAAVLIAPDDLDSLLETLEVLSDPSATEAIREAEAGEADLISGDELAALMSRRRGTDASRDASVD